MTHLLIQIALHDERDVVVARQRVRAIAGLIGFDSHDQTRVATAVSEFARAAVQRGSGGRLVVTLDSKSQPQCLGMQIEFDLASTADPDSRGGRSNVSGEPSQPAWIAELAGARRLLDGFDYERAGASVRLVLKKQLVRLLRPFGPDDVPRIALELARMRPSDPLDELQRQNQELVLTLDELRRRQSELVELNRELEDTNRGVVALYAELDERNDHLRRADDLKRRFLSNMSHEFRTPLHSVMALARLLLDRTDGELSAEQEKQVRFIDSSARDLLEIVEDLLDIAKVEAGRLEARPTEFAIEEVFGGLRGMLRPLLAHDRLHLVFEDASALPPMFSDHGKLSQILRNLVSNALKFTHYGEVRISAAIEAGAGEDAPDVVIFRVTDSGIGIAAADFDRIFEEFGQVDGPVQARVKGTGLGLPLSKKLARLLGGDLSVTSELGVGSTFTLRLPRQLEAAPLLAGDTQEEPVLRPVLILDDDSVDRFLLEKHLRGGGFEPILAASVREARACLARVEPVAAVLDVMLRGEDVWPLLAEIKGSERSKGVPVIVITQGDERDKAAQLGSDGYLKKPIDRATLLHELARLHVQPGMPARDIRRDPAMGTTGERS